MTSGPALYTKLDLSPDDILLAYHETFTREPGYTVLRHLYESIMAGDQAEPEAPGRLSLYNGIVRNLWQYEALQQQRAQG